MFGLIPVRDWIYLGAILGLLVGFTWFVHHERQIGRQQIEQADRDAKVKLDIQVKADELARQADADKAAKERQDVQQTLDDYMASHRTGPIRLCVATNNRGSGLPQAPGPGTSSTDSSSSPADLRQMSGRDISGDLDTLVRSAETLDALYRECQALRQ